MAPETQLRFRFHLREDFVMHCSSKDSSDAEKRFQPAERRVFFAYDDAYSPASRDKYSGLVNDFRKLTRSACFSPVRSSGSIPPLINGDSGAVCV
jgi:hypothetical protein